MCQSLIKSLQKRYDENNIKRYIFQVDGEYPKDLYKFHNNLPFLPEKMKMKTYFQPVCDLYDKEKYVTHIRTLKQALNHRFLFKKVHKVIDLNQKTWLKSIY